jgi:hypothetical protein
MKKRKRELFLSLTAQATAAKVPEYTVQVNDVVLACPDNTVITGIGRNQVDYRFECEEVHSIKISLVNKEPGDTKVSSDGTITEDLYLVIDKITVDQIDLTNKISKISSYVGTDGQVRQTHGYISFNGSVTIKIHKNLLYTDFLSSLL